MEHGSLQDFIDDAMRKLSEVRAALRGFNDGSTTSLPAGNLSVQLDAILYGAKELELEEIAATAKEAIGVVFETAAGKCEPSKAIQCLSRLETQLLRKSLEDDYLSLDLACSPSGQLFPEPEKMPEFEFSVSEATPVPPVAVTADEPIMFTPEPELEGFEIDDELLEIFGGEAEELLQNIERSLEALSANPNDKDSLWEIRRNAHTFKGSAGIVGLKQISELAHRVEDLLDRLAETSAESNPGILNILHSSFDCLKALTAGEKSPSLFHRISQLYYDFDGALAGLEIREEEVPAELPPTFTSSAAPLRVGLTADVEPTLDAITIDETAFAIAPEEKQATKAAPSRSVVRVSLDRLDELVAIVRDMIIGRSTFEQRLKELERQIEELHNTTRRLQTTSTKLEVDFEASMLNSERPAMFGSSMLGEHGFMKPVDGFDELEFDKYTDFHQSTREIAEVTSDTFAINTGLDVLRGNLEILFDDQRRLVEDMHEKLMRIRMVEFGSLSTRLQRAVRVTCEEEMKKADVVIENEAVDIDTQILDTLAEPLMHLLKNAVVHGIEMPNARLSAGKPETGTIRVTVKNEETHIMVAVTDDGRGIVPDLIVEKAIALGLAESETTASLSTDEALNMIFLPGLSTAEKLNLSAGRGVGMSIVKESIQAKKGTISIDSKPGAGTRFLIRMPLPLAVTNVLIVSAGRQMYAVPRKQASQIVEIEDAETLESIEIAGETLPLISLSDRLGIAPQAHVGPRYAIAVRSAEFNFAILVDEIRGCEEIVIKPLGQPLDKIDVVLGAAILGSGDLVPIVDVMALIRNAKEAKVPVYAPAAAPEPITVLIVDDSPSVRHLTSKVIVSAGWNVMTAKDGLDALEQLRLAPALPAVILSDIEMPRMDGYEFAASLQRIEEFCKIPVVMITSRSAEKHRDKAFDSGVSQYLTKPYDDKELLDTVRILGNVT